MQKSGSGSAGGTSFEAIGQLSMLRGRKSCRRLVQPLSGSGRPAVAVKAALGKACEETGVLDRQTIRTSAAASGVTRVASVGDGHMADQR